MLDQDAILAKMIEGNTPKPKPTIKAVPKKDKPRYTAAQVAQYMEEQRLLKLPVNMRIVRLQEAYDAGFTTTKGCEHPACRLGCYMGEFDPNSPHNYVRMCKRCHGHVEIDAKKAASNYTYQSHKRQGTSKHSHKSYNPQNGFVIGASY